MYQGLNYSIYHYISIEWTVSDYHYKRVFLICDIDDIIHEVKECMSYIILFFHEPLIKLIKEEAVLSIPVVYTMNYYSYYKFVDFRPGWIVL